MKSAYLCRTVCTKSGKKHTPHGNHQNPWENKQISQNPGGKKHTRATVIVNPLKTIGKTAFRAMGEKHTSVPSVVRTVGSMGNPCKTIGKTSDSLHNHWALTFRGRRRIYACYSYRKTLENHQENNVFRVTGSHRKSNPCLSEHLFPIPCYAFIILGMAGSVSHPSVFSRFTSW